MDAIKFTEGTLERIKKSDHITIATLICSTLLVCFVIFCAFNFVQKKTRQIYLVDQAGQAMAATAEDGSSQREKEAYNHLLQFHELLFTIVPNNEMIRQNIKLAHNLSDDCVEEFYNDLSEQRFYSKIIETNSFQYISVDSVITNLQCYPYKAVVYASTYFQRESNITEYKIITRCNLAEVPRTEKNAHGLMIRNFELISNERGHTQKRK